MVLPLSALPQGWLQTHITGPHLLALQTSQQLRRLLRFKHLMADLQ